MMNSFIFSLSLLSFLTFAVFAVPVWAPQAKLLMDRVTSVGMLGTGEHIEETNR